MGKLYIVGIGPGNYDNMTVRADKVLRDCDVILGYTVYVELIRKIYPEKEYITTGMTRESQRCESALSLAAAGKNAVLICSGDSGIYGLASLVYELRGEKDDPEIEVIPGLTAAISAGALLGAPLTHDFAVISLSDRLTSWQTIETRLRAAAEGDFCIVLYNPASRSRKDHLKKACDILMEKIENTRICGIVRNAGRDGEQASILTLEELKNTQADMFCTVFIGNSKTRKICANMVTPRGYLEK